MSNVKELEILKDCIIDVLTRLPQLTWLSAGQLDGELNPDAGVLKKLSLAGLAQLSQPRYSCQRFGLAVDPESTIGR